MNKGYFTISLDFELFWGVHDGHTIEQYGQNVRNVSQVIPRLLQLFQRYGIHATFGVVGGMYHRSYDEFRHYIKDADRLPHYQTMAFSPYTPECAAKMKEHPELFFQPDLIRLVREAGQEIGTHTYSHYYVDVPGIDSATFEYDIQQAVAIAKEQGDVPRSIIFPRNQEMPDEFRKILRENGIVCYRSNRSPMDNRTEAWVRIYRLAATYLPICDRTCEPVLKGGLLAIPASHFLRHSYRNRLIDCLQVSNVKRGMRSAAKRNRLYHLWWHPHNFGTDMEYNLANLEEILKYFVQLREQYGFTSASMGVLAEILSKKL
jgi:hypothetical protein